MKTLGRTGVQVTALGFGAASIGNLYREVLDDEAAAAVRAAWDRGVRYFDTAPHYGLGRIDIVLIHDPEESDQPERALTEGYAALHELRSQGVIGAVGVGSKQVQILHRFVTETELDTIMLAGRYTLLEQPALDELLPACEKHGVSVLNVGVFNSGLLAKDWPEDDGHYEYGDAPPELVERARRVATVCRAHGTSLPHAALVFAGAHPTVASVVAGAGRAAHMIRNADLAAAPPPPARLWEDLVAQGLLRADAPVPTS